MPNINGRPYPTNINTVTTQNAVGANGNGTSVTVYGGNVLRITTLGASSPTMNVVFEFSDDGGSTWFNMYAQDLTSATGIATLINSVVVTTTKTHHNWIVPPGINTIRTRVSGFVLGTVTCVVNVLSNN